MLTMENLIAQSFPELTNISHLDAGGFKYVLSVTHPIDGDNVLKIIDPKSAPERIDREILASQVVQSVRVPKFLDTGTVDLPEPLGQCVWIREQKVSGISLRRHLLTAGALTALDTLRLTQQMLEALADAELAKIVHRDVKPENIMIDHLGDFWLLDFGIARHLAMPTLTLTGAAVVCTPGYAPPEQFQNMRDTIDSRSDLFALGVTIYETATGNHPFRDNANSPQEIFQRTITQALPLLNLQIKKSQEFRDLIASLVGKRKDLRLRSVTEALEWANEIVQAQI
jgi:eukaryotic-like serine/threonine-protein kinase